MEFLYCFINKVNLCRLNSPLWNVIAPAAVLSNAESFPVSSSQMLLFESWLRPERSGGAYQPTAGSPYRRSFEVRLQNWVNYRPAGAGKVWVAEKLPGAPGKQEFTFSPTPGTRAGEKGDQSLKPPSEETILEDTCPQTSLQPLKKFWTYGLGALPSPFALRETCLLSCGGLGNKQANAYPAKGGEARPRDPLPLPSAVTSAPPHGGYKRKRVRVHSWETPGAGGWKLRVTLS